jgi:hypothetical protein
MKSHYSRQGLWTLFLMCAFMPHVWALILIARDMSWVTERSNAWDAIGVASYGLLFTLVESLLIFAVMCLLGLLTPRGWSIERRTAFLGVLVLSGLSWAVIDQLAFLVGFSPPGSVLGFLARSEHPVRWMYGLAAAIVLPTMLIPALWVIRSERGLRIARQVMERLALLAAFYLFFDLLGILVLLIRNIG